ncbi:MAG TPA: DUF5076 domain-containing protein [Candidatus Binatia bacterium]|nr:DUF5076 domain-containing protein [Candidatus Binatia bacterium]
MGKELIAPEIAEEDPNSYELIRVWAARGAQHVSMHWSVWKEDPKIWGTVLAHLAGHLANAYQQEKNLDREETIRAIRAGFNAELDFPTQTPDGKVRNRRMKHKKEP